MFWDWVFPNCGHVKSLALKAALDFHLRNFVCDMFLKWKKHIKQHESAVHEGKKEFSDFSPVINSLDTIDLKMHRSEFLKIRKSILVTNILKISFFLPELMQYVQSIVLFSKYYIKNIAIDELLPFMNWFNTPVHSVFVRKNFATIITIEWQFSFMKWFNMAIQ